MDDVSLIQKTEYTLRRKGKGSTSKLLSTSKRRVLKVNFHNQILLIKPLESVFWPALLNSDDIN